MACYSIWLLAIPILLFAVLIQSQAQNNIGQEKSKVTAAADQIEYTASCCLSQHCGDSSGYQPRNGSLFDLPYGASKEIVAEEVLVESNLRVYPKPSTVSRRVQREIVYLIPDQHEYLVFKPLNRAKRQFQGGFNRPGFPNNQFNQPNKYDSSQATSQSHSNSHAFGPTGFGSADALAGAQAFQTNGPLGGFGASSTNTGTNSISSSINGPSSVAAGFSGGQTYNLPNGHTINLAYNTGYSNSDGSPASSSGSAITYTK